MVSSVPWMMVEFLSSTGCSVNRQPKSIEVSEKMKKERSEHL
jgi:hypothetical protein